MTDDCTKMDPQYELRTMYSKMHDYFAECLVERELDESERHLLSASALSEPDLRHRILDILEEIRQVKNDLVKIKTRDIDVYSGFYMNLVDELEDLGGKEDGND